MNQTPEQMSAAGGDNGCSPVLDPPVALAPKMVAQLPAADKSPQEFSAPSLMIRSETKKYGCNIEIEDKGGDERQDQPEERKIVPGRAVMLVPGREVMLEATAEE